MAIFDGGLCNFVSEFQELPHSERVKQLEINNKALISAFENRAIDAKDRFTTVSQSLSATLKSQRNKPIETTKLIEETNDRLRKEYESEFESLRRKITDNQDKMKKIELSHQLELSNAQDTVVKKLIPIYDKLDSIVSELNESTEINESQTELTNFYENIQSAQLKLLEVLRNQGLKPIDTIGIPLNSKEHHEEKRKRVFSDDYPRNSIVTILNPGYKLNEQVIQKAQVVISKGRKQSEWSRNLGSAQLSIYTEDSSYTLHDVRQRPDSIKGIEKNGSMVHIKTSELLFAFQEQHWDIVAEEILFDDPILIKRPYNDEFLSSIRVSKDAGGVNRERYNYNFVLKGSYI